MAQSGPSGPEWSKWPRVVQMAQSFPNGPKWPKWPRVAQMTNLLENSETNFFLGRPVHIYTYSAKPSWIIGYVEYFQININYLDESWHVSQSRIYLEKKTYQPMVHYNTIIIYIWHFLPGTWISNRGGVLFSSTELPGRWPGARWMRREEKGGVARFWRHTGQCCHSPEHCFPFFPVLSEHCYFWFFLRLLLPLPRILLACLIVLLLVPPLLFALNIVSLFHNLGFKSLKWSFWFQGKLLQDNGLNGFNYNY